MNVGRPEGLVYELYRSLLCVVAGYSGLPLWKLFEDEVYGVCAKYQTGICWLVSVVRGRLLCANSISDVLFAQHSPYSPPECQEWLGERLPDWFFL